MKDKISILLLLLVVANPLLAANPCQVDCLASGPLASASAAHGPHAGHQGHANHGQQPSALSVSSSTCGLHAAAALQSRAYLLSGPDKAQPAGIHTAPLESAVALVAHTSRSGSLGLTQPPTSIPAGTMSLRI